MRLLLGFDVDLPDNVAQHLIRAAGPTLPHEDYALALALAIIQPFPPQIRSLLLTPGHEYVPFGVPTVLTTANSATQVSLIIALPEGEEPPTWMQSPASKPSSSKPKPKARKRVIVKNTASPSKSTRGRRM